MNAGMHIKKVLLFYSSNWELWKVLSTGGALLLSIVLKVVFPVLLLVVLILLDMRLGIKKSIKHRKEKGEVVKSERSYHNVRSDGLRRTFSKMADYAVIILVAIVFEGVLEHMGINIKYDNFTLSNLIVLLLCITELKSVDENIKELQNISLLKSIIDFVFRRKSVSEIISSREGNEKV